MNIPVQQLDLPLNRDNFLRQLLHHLTGALQDVVGLKQAEGFVAMVAQRIGEELNQDYRTALGTTKLNKQQVIDVLIDLKRRINGNFYVISVDEHKIVFGNSCCPFEDKVRDRPSLCMMTSNVFGLIAAENLGYAKLVIHESFALGHDRCHVTLFLQPDEYHVGAEYFGSEI